MNTTTLPVNLASVDDCWNRIGVAGDQSCEKLDEHVHCRNCGVYANAAQRNLERPVGTDYKKDWAAHFRRAASDTQTLDASCLVFRIGREWLSLPTKLFVAVAPQAKSHRLPPLSWLIAVSSQVGSRSARHRARPRACRRSRF